MTYYIGSARHDERGRYVKGRAGDQTGNEVATQKMYDYISKGGWLGFRFKNPYYGIAMGNCMLTACSNNHIGYSQTDRYGIIRDGINTKKNTNCDCGTLVRECIKESCGVDVGDFTTASEAAALKNSGLFIELGKVTKHSLLYEGDIIVTARKGHTAVITTGLSRADEVRNNPKSKVASIRLMGVKYALNFCAEATLADSRNVLRVKVLQHALNLDYDAGLEEDGIFGNKTAKALGSHYVRYGEKQYLVSAAEIFCYMCGSDPKGFEVPGIYGAGLKAGTGRSKLNADWFIKMVQ